MITDLDSAAKKRDPQSSVGAKHGDERAGDPGDRIGKDPCPSCSAKPTSARARAPLADALAATLSSRSNASEYVRTCVHELGHAVVAHSLGMWVKAILVSAEAMEEWLGPDECKKQLGICFFDRSVETECGELLLTRTPTPEEEACVSAAGLAAESIAGGSDPMRSWGRKNGSLRYRGTWLGVRSDWTDAMKLLSPEGRAYHDWRHGQAVRRAYLASARRAIGILSDERRQRAILTLLPLLMEAGSLSGVDVNAALGWHRLRQEPEA